MEAKRTPLIELLERVPRDAVLVVEHDQFSSSSHPVGRLCHEAAAALEEAREDASIERRALLWLAGGDSGASSEAICHHMLGMKSDGSFPWDPSDLGRCLRLLKRFPEWKPRIHEMARYSAQWAALVERWDELAEMMADEVGIDWSKGKRAPLTYAAMKDAIDQARGKENGNG